MVVGGILGGEVLLVADTRRNILGGPEEPTSTLPKLHLIHEQLSCQWAGIEQVALMAMSALQLTARPNDSPQSVSDQCQRALQDTWRVFQRMFGHRPDFSSFSDVGCGLMCAGHFEGRPFIVRVVLAGEGGFHPAPVLTLEHGHLDLMGGEDHGSQGILLSEINLSQPNPQAWVEAASRAIWEVSRQAPNQIGGDVDWEIRSPLQSRRTGHIDESRLVVHRISASGYQG